MVIPLGRMDLVGGMVGSDWSWSRAVWPMVVGYLLLGISNIEIWRELSLHLIGQRLQTFVQYQ